MIPSGRVYGGCHQVYGNINDTGSGISLNIFLFLLNKVSWAGRPSVHTSFVV